MRTILAVIATATLMVTAQAANTDTVPVNIIGSGIRTCGQYIKDRRANDQGQLVQYVAWVDGFMDSYQFRGNWNEKWVNTKPLNSMPETDDVLLYLEKYCTDHPLGNVLQGTMALTKDIGAVIATH